MATFNKQLTIIDEYKELSREKKQDEDTPINKIFADKQDSDSMESVNHFNKIETIQIENSKKHLQDKNKLKVRRLGHDTPQAMNFEPTNFSEGNRRFSSYIEICNSEKNMANRKLNSQNEEQQPQNKYFNANANNLKKEAFLQYTAGKKTVNDNLTSLRLEELTPRELNGGNCDFPHKKRSSQNLNCIKEKEALQNNEAKDKKPKLLTMEQALSEMNKPYISIGKNKKKGWGSIRAALNKNNIGHTADKPTSQQVLSKDSVKKDGIPYSQLQSLQKNLKIEGNETQSVGNASNSSRSEQQLFQNNDPAQLLKKMTTMGYKSSYDKARINTENFDDSIVEIIKKKEYFKEKFRVIIYVILAIARIKLRIIKYGAIVRNPVQIIKADPNLSQPEKDRSSSQIEEKDFNHHEEYFTGVYEISQAKVPWYLISYDSKILRYWNYFVFLITIYIILGLPYRLAFTDDVLALGSVMFPFDIFIECCFILDFFAHCITAYPSDGGIETRVYKIILRYLNGWLVIDLISVFPFYVFEWDFEMNSRPATQQDFFLLFRLPKFYRLLRLIRILKITKQLNSGSFMKKLEISMGFSAGIIKVLTFIVTSFVICHIFSCIWYYIAKLDNFNPETWVYRYKWLDETKPCLYLKSLYFAFTSFLTVGYGDIVASSQNETIVVIIWLVFAGIYYSFSLSSLGGVFLASNAKNIEINNSYRIVKEISKKNKFSRQLEEKIKHYVAQNAYKDKEKFDFKIILDELPVDLRYKIAIDIYDQRITNIHIFNECRKDFIANIIPLLEPKNYEKSTYIYMAKDVPDNIYFIIEGNVCYVTEDLIAFSSISKGSYFGEIEIILKTYRESGILTKSNCFCLLMKKKMFFEDAITDVIFREKIFSNMIKRYNFHNSVKDMVEELIDIGKNIWENEYYETRSKKNEKYNFGKIYFNLGLRSYMENNSSVDMTSLETLLQTNTMKTEAEFPQPSRRFGKTSTVRQLKMRREKKSKVITSLDFSFFQNELKHQKRSGYKIERAETLSFHPLGENGTEVQKENADQLKEQMKTIQEENLQLKKSMKELESIINTTKENEESPRKDLKRKCSSEPRQNTLRGNRKNKTSDDFAIKGFDIQKDEGLLNIDNSPTRRKAVYLKNVNLLKALIELNNN